MSPNAGLLANPSSVSAEYYTSAAPRKEHLTRNTDKPTSNMKFTLESSAQNLISHYGIGDIGVNGQAYAGSLIITPNQLAEDWYSGEVANLSMADFEPLFALQQEPPTEIIVLGTGTEHVFPPMQLMAELHAKGVALEVMNTRAACRTYSVLVSEQRPVAAALLPIT